MFPRCNCNSLRQATRKVTQLYDRALAPTNLRATQYAMLVEIGRMGSSTLNPLAEAMVMDRATLGHNLRPLEAAGYVKVAVGKDKRSREITLTAAGRKILAEATPLWEGAQKTFEGEIGAKDAAMLRSLLHNVSATEFGTVS